MKKYLTPDDYFDDQEKWRTELNILRSLLHETELEEVMKWSFPCYSLNNKNVVGIGNHSTYFGLWFFQGVFLSDPQQVLINAQEGKTKAMRQWRMASEKDINKKMIRQYLAEAIENQKSGLEVKSAPANVSESTELLDELNKDRTLQSQFQKLTPGRQKEYHEFINSAKRESTKMARIEKSKVLIYNGLGLNDRYR